MIAIRGDAIPIGLGAIDVRVVTSRPETSYARRLFFAGGTAAIAPSD